MKRFFLSLLTFLCFLANMEAKDLVVYFSATGNTQAVAQQIALLTGADIIRIEAAQPYAANPYDDSNRIQREAYNDLRPAVANLPTKEAIAQYDRIFVGSPIWWHQPAMVVCTFLEAFNLTDKTIVPFFTYGATTYLNESMHKIYKVTPNSRHIPATLPTDLNPDDITTPGPADDSDIDMPGNARGVEAWMKRLGLLSEATSISNTTVQTPQQPFLLTHNGNRIDMSVIPHMSENVVNVYALNGTLLHHTKNVTFLSLLLPSPATYLFSLIDKKGNKQYTQKVNI